MGIEIGQLADEISKALQEYTREVTEELEKAKQEIAKEGVKELKKTSPKRTGEYRKGWRTKKQGTAQIVYNATKPQLTHLLEKGHAKRGGGRVPGQPHIAPVEEKMVKEFEERVERAIRG